MLTVTDDLGKPQHDDDGLTLPLFLDLYDRWLAEEHPDSYSFIKNNFIVNRQMILVWTAEQAIALSRRTSDDPPHSFKNPAQVLPSLR